VYHAVTAARTVVHGVIVHQSRFFVNQILGFDYFFFSHNFISLSVGEPYKKLHQLDKDCRAAYVDKHFEIFFGYKIDDDGCDGQYHKEDIQYVSYFIGIHRFIYYFLFTIYD
jgi:hypothetical protein